jgi:hypothetical protein
VVEPQLFERLGRLGPVDGPDRPREVGGIPAQRLVGGLGQILITAQTRASEPNRQNCVLAQQLLQLCAQLDRTRWFDSHRLTRWVIGSRVGGGRSRLTTVIGARPRRTTHKSGNGDTRHSHNRHPGRH